MKKSVLFFIPCFLLVAASFIACSDKEDNDNNDAYKSEKTLVDMIPKKTPIKLTDVQKTYVKANNNFSFELFRQTCEKNKSSVLSPLSVTYVLGMLNDGAEGTTAWQIMKVLGFEGADKTAVNEFCANLIENAPKVDPNVRLNLANAIFLNASRGIHLLPDYQQDMKRYYHAEAQSLEFADPSAVKTINQWCDRQTNGMISKILNETDPDMLICLLNAIYFKATWTDKFNPEHTTDQTFTKEDGTTLKLPLMHRHANVMWAHYNNFTSICLPYSSGAFQMYLFLPDEYVTTKQVLDNLNADSFEQMKVEMYPKSTDVRIPRFTTTVDDLDLKKSLKKMGVIDAFTTDAQFPYITSQNVYVSLIKQVAKIIVNEEGTEAAAVTVAKEYETGESTDFIANRPFVYLIQEATSGAIFFIGTYMGD